MMTESNTALQSYIDRLVSLNKEKAQVADLIKELKSEAKNNGFDPTAMEELVKRILASEETLKKRREKEDLARIYAKALNQINLFD
jgi:uncharacterized protein (UPF0335 family)